MIQTANTICQLSPLTESTVEKENSDHWLFVNYQNLQTIECQTITVSCFRLSQWVVYFNSPVSMASMRASVSLLRMQSMSWRWVFSPAESMRRSLGRSWPLLPPPPEPRDRALRPSNNSTSRRSTSLIESREHLQIHTSSFNTTTQEKSSCQLRQMISVWEKVLLAGRQQCFLTKVQFIQSRGSLKSCHQALSTIFV